MRLRGRRIGTFNGDRARVVPSGAGSTVSSIDLVDLIVAPLPEDAVMLWDLQPGEAQTVPQEAATTPRREGETRPSKLITSRGPDPRSEMN